MNKAEKETLLRRTAPSRQKQAQEYLQGGFPLGGSCQWPRPLTDEGQVRQYSPFAEWPHGRGRTCPARGLPTDAILPFC